MKGNRPPERSKASGVQMLTIAMKPSTTSSSSFACLLTRSATLPLGFHDEPGSAEQGIARRT
jgi:hypothetical protein